MFFFAEAKRALSRACLALEQQTTGGKHVQPLFDEAHELAAHSEGEIHFAEFCERLTQAMLNDRGGMLVVLATNPATPVPELDTSVELLARSASSTKVRYLVIDARLSERFEQPLVWCTCRLKYQLDPAQIEQGMKERLEAPDCGLVERLRYLAALSATALANDDPELALERGLEALQLSATSQASEETTYAWYGLGNVLYQCAAFEPAERAYAECVDRSLDEHNDWFAAQGMAGMGHTYFMRESFDRALSCYATARTIWRKLRHPHGEIYALTWHAEAAARLREFSTALALFDEALALCGDTDPALADAYRSTRAELLMRKAAACGEANLGDQQRQCQAEAQRLGAVAPVCDHP
jgi:tetratricopeptide (TPR) repeat protein